MKKRSVHRIGLVVALTASAAVFLASELAGQDRRLGGVGITVFRDENFRGENATFRSDVPDLRRYGFNDRITSLASRPGSTGRRASPRTTGVAARSSRKRNGICGASVGPTGSPPCAECAEGEEAEAADTRISGSAPARHRGAASSFTTTLISAATRSRCADRPKTSAFRASTTAPRASACSRDAGSSAPSRGSGAARSSIATSPISRASA